MARHGENIRKREDGRWEARFVYRPTADGKKVTKSVYGKTYLEAKQRRNAFLEEFNRKNSVIPTLHVYPEFRDVASFWMNYKLADIKESSATTYSRILNLYLLPALGDKKINQIDSTCINDFLYELQRHGRSRWMNASGGTNVVDTVPSADSNAIVAASDDEAEERIAASDTQAEKCVTASGTQADTCTDVPPAGMTAFIEVPATGVDTSVAVLAPQAEGHAVIQVVDMGMSADTDVTAVEISEDAAEIIVEPAVIGKKPKGLSPKTVADIKSVLMEILKYAQMLKIIGSIPECRRVPRIQPNIEVLTKVELEKLERILFDDIKPIYVISLLSLYTGIRIGEACGLQWKDVDLVNGTISITKTVLRIANMDEEQNSKTKLVIQTPKSQASIRVIPIPEMIVNYLRRQKDGDDVFLASGKDTFTEPRLCQYRFEKLLNQAEIRHYKFHVLRHTFATRCIESGVDVKTLSEIMGHSNVAITMQRYVHPSLEMKRTQINKLEKI